MGIQVRKDIEIISNIYEQFFSESFYILVVVEVRGQGYQDNLFEKEDSNVSHAPAENNKLQYIGFLSSKCNRVTIVCLTMRSRYLKSCKFEKGRFQL